ncbi:hypothetical protein JOQ06_013879 [Pogonophryne albipinna]|uniref:Uncharacterized protein n=1 Tax=Pogonophryne albipinna TaxID=1090488 RepID=A0AAD6A6J2_9TELE|nr:hypothetical protein JOQ06_013879 [Pogonophryne albipinna]
MSGKRQLSILSCFQNNQLPKKVARSEDTVEEAVEEAVEETVEEVEEQWRRLGRTHWKQRKGEDYVEQPHIGVPLRRSGQLDGHSSQWEPPAPSTGAQCADKRTPVLIKA